MCGICGYTKFNHSYEDNIDLMMKMRLSNVGQFFKTRNNFVSLGHSRLSIIDLSANANQPFISNDGKYSIVYTGEIYNYKSIKTELEKNLTQNLEPSDTEVVLNGYIYLK